MIDPGFIAPAWATVFLVMPMILTALTIALILGGTAATAKGIHHTVKTGDYWWDDPAAHGAITVGGVPAVGTLLEAGVNEIAGRNPDWKQAGIGAGISTAALLAGGAANAATPATQSATLLAEAAEGVVTPAAMEGLGQVAKEAPAQLLAGTVAGKATQVAEQFPVLSSLGEAATKGTNSALENAIGAIETGWDTINQGADWVNQNITAPARTAMRTPDRILSPMIGKGPANIIGGGLRGAASGAASNHKNPLRGMATGIAGSVTGSALEGALGGVLPMRTDAGDTFTRNMRNSASTPTALMPEISRSSMGDPFSIGNSLRPENAGGLGQSLAGGPYGQAAINAGTNMVTGLTKQFTNDALAPTPTAPRNPLLPKSLGEIQPMQRARMYGGMNRRPNYSGMYNSTSPFNNRKYI
jgi:hypothetical protein